MVPLLSYSPSESSDSLTAVPGRDRPAVPAQAVWRPFWRPVLRPVDSALLTLVLLIMPRETGTDMLQVHFLVTR